MVTFTATDSSGNSSQKQLTVHVVYKFIGYFPPVNNGIWNNINSGQSAPMKWQLAAADGTYVSDVSAVKSITSAAETCGVSSSVPMDSTATDSLSGLRYDSTAQQFMFVWRTSKIWAGTCRRFSLQVKDGNTYGADFAFK